MTVSTRQVAVLALWCLGTAGLAACGGETPPAPSAADESSVPADSSTEGDESAAAPDVDPDSVTASYDPGSSPADTVTTYLAAMAAHEGSPDLDLYTDASRERMAGRTMGPGPMDTLVRTYGACPAPEAREQGDYAVVEHPGEDGCCSPWFLERGADGLWRLDFVAMGEAIRFDDHNQWRIANRAALGPYAFAFDQ